MLEFESNEISFDSKLRVFQICKGNTMVRELNGLEQLNLFQSNILLIDYVGWFFDIESLA